MTDEGILGRTETGRNIRSLCGVQPLHRSGSNHVFTIKFHWLLYPVRNEIGRSCPDLREKTAGPDRNRKLRKLQGESSNTTI